MAAEDEQQPALKPGTPEWEASKLAEYGFYCHYVPLENGYVNAHTHGVPGSWPGQLDLQVVAGIGPTSCQHIFSDFVSRIRKGERFSDGDRVTKILTLPVLLKEVRDGLPESRRVLRVLIPDKNGTLPGDAGHDPQWTPLQESLDTEGD